MSQKRRTIADVDRLLDMQIEKAETDFHDAQARLESAQAQAVADAHTLSLLKDLKSQIQDIGSASNDDVPEA